MIQRLYYLAIGLIVSITCAVAICMYCGGIVEEYRWVVIPCFIAVGGLISLLIPIEPTSEQLYTDVCPLTCQYIGDHGCAIGEWSTTCPHREGGGVGINDLA